MSKRKTSIAVGAILVALIVFLSFAMQKKLAKQQASIVLAHRIPHGDKRFKTFQYVLRLMHKRNVKTIVETGTARNGQCNCSGDGCSSPIWGQWAKQNGAFVYSVDIDPKAIESSSFACLPYLERMVFAVSDSVEFLEKFNKPIDFLYLDSEV